MNDHPPISSLSTAPCLSTPETGSIPRQAVTSPRARLLLRLDGLVEAALGLVLISSPLTGLSAALRLPHPAVDPVLVGLGALLLPALPILRVAARQPRRRTLTIVAAANGASALL